MRKRFFKIVTDGYITFIGEYGNIGETISESEYNTIKSIIDSKPEDTETHYYMLKADTLEYEALERPVTITLKTGEVTE